MNNNTLSNQYGEIKICDRKKISLSGVKRVVNFNSEEFLIESTLGVITLKGSELEILKLDTTDQILTIKGRFNSLSYSDTYKKSESSFISRLFK